MKNKTDKVNLFFIGESFYSKSGTMMSSIYVVGTYERYDWAMVGLALKEGMKVNIRPATQAEMNWAYLQLGVNIARRWERENERFKCVVCGTVWKKDELIRGMCGDAFCGANVKRA